MVLVNFDLLLTSSQELSFRCWENLVITRADCWKSLKIPKRLIRAAQLTRYEVCLWNQQVQSMDLSIRHLRFFIIYFI